MTCGVGIQTRGHWCQRDNEVIDKSYCYAEAEPVHQKKCVMICSKWSFSKWSSVSPLFLKTYLKSQQKIQKKKKIK